ncbi:MAG TPA: hypothetical protein VJQ56_01925 [Blastocatellia bacterium]|nr:hypothetical protein [Blastocatellia bacterium]
MRILFTISWVILLVLAVLLVVLSLNSLRVGYGSMDSITPNFELNQISQIAGTDVIDALRGRRVTAATWALASGVLAAFIAFVPYRRGERWAWWALLIALGTSQLLSLLRVVAFGSTFGSGAAATVLVFLLIGLLAGVPRLFINKETEL